MTTGPHAARAKGSGSRLLVADDSEADRIAAREALIAAGYEVLEAFDGQHALEVFARERPDLVLLDVVMPRLSGLETCRILKAKTQSTYLPVIMVSTRNSVNARVEGLRSGADDYLGKPYDVEELRARVEALLRARRVLAAPGDASERDAKGGPKTAVSWKRRLEEEFDRAERYSDPLACLRIELDAHARLVAHGEGVATEMIDRVRGIIEASVRKIDLVFRADVRGYLLVLPNTHFPGALAVAERIWRDIQRLRLPEALGGQAATVSIGVSFYPNKDTHTLEDLQGLVEAALGRAREEGGGKICLFQHQGYLYAPEA